MNSAPSSGRQRLVRPKPAGRLSVSLGEMIAARQGVPATAAEPVQPPEADEQQRVGFVQPRDADQPYSWNYEIAVADSTAEDAAAAAAAIAHVRARATADGAYEFFDSEARCWRPWICLRIDRIGIEEARKEIARTRPHTFGRWGAADWKKREAAR